MRKNKIIPKNFSHAVDILESILSKDIIDDLLKTDAYSHFGIGLFIRNQLLYFENPFWEFHSADDMSELIYKELMQRIKYKKLFSKRELTNFLNEPKKYASAKCLSDINYMIEFKGFRGGSSTRKYENKEVLFSKDKSNNALLFSSKELYNFDDVYEYSLDGDILSISWGFHRSVFKLYDDFKFDFKLKKRDDIGKKLYEYNESFGFKVHDRKVIKIDDIKDDVIKEYFHNQDISLDIWQNTILMKCFNVNPDFGHEYDFFGLEHSGIPWWMIEYEDKQLTECLSVWKEENLVSNKDVENIEKIKHLTPVDTLNEVIKSKEKSYNLEVLKTIFKVYKRDYTLSNIRFIKNIYLTLYDNLKMEKYFSKEKIRAFRKDEKNYANAKCISDKCTNIYKDSYRVSIESFENKDVLIRFDKNKEIFSIFTTSQYMWIDFSEYNNIHKYSIDDNLLSISYADKISVFELFEDVIYN